MEKIVKEAKSSRLQAMHQSTAMVIHVGEGGSSLKFCPLKVARKSKMESEKLKTNADAGQSNARWEDDLSAFTRFAMNQVHDVIIEEK
mgnify:CR=1 FL=1